MRTHTNAFKEEIAKNGRQINGRLYFYRNYDLIDENNNKIITENNIQLISEQANLEEKELIDEEMIYRIDIIKNGQFLKSLMKQCNFETQTNLNVGTIVNPQLGLLVNGSYEYLDYGNYIIYSKEYNAENKTWNYVCYDKMLYSMLKYEPLNVTYPCLISQYVNALASRINLPFKNAADEFTNFDQVILAEPFNGQDVTYRDVLDKLSEIVAGSFIINDDDELEIALPTVTGDVINEENLKDVNVNFGEKFGPINKVAITETDGGYEYSAQDDDSIEANGLTQINIVDNIFAFNGQSETIAQNILDNINYTEYSINDFKTTGVCYYDFLDVFQVQIGETLYPCMLLNNEINIMQGIEENIYTSKYENSEKESNNYKVSSLSDSEVKFMINKQKGLIESKVSKGEVISEINQSPEQIKIQAEKVNLNGYVTVNDLSGTGTTTINGSNITTGTIDASQVNVSNIDASNINTGTLSANRISGGTISGSSFNITGSNAISVYGSDNLLDAQLNRYGLYVYDDNGLFAGKVSAGNVTVSQANTYPGIGMMSSDNLHGVLTFNLGTQVVGDLKVTGNINANGTITPGSLEEFKKDITLYNNNSIDIIKNAEIYNYKYKEDKTNKNRIGFIIGDKYKTPNELIDKDGIDLYSMCGILWKGIQEQQKVIENLQKRIEDLEKDVK